MSEYFISGGIMVSCEKCGCELLYDEAYDDEGTMYCWDCALTICRKYWQGDKQNGA